MKKRIILTAFLMTVLISVLSVSAYADSTYSYTDDISSGSAETTLLTELNTSAETWTLYPGVTQNGSGSLAVSGTGVSVDYSNYSDYAGYFYQDTDGNIYQFSGCAYTQPSTGTHVTGGSVAYGGVVSVTFSNVTICSYSNVQVLNGQICMAGSYSSSLIKYTYMATEYGCFYYISMSYNGRGQYTYTGQFVTYVGDDTYAWNFRAVPTCTVTFDPQSGSVSPSMATLIYNSTYGTLPIPTKTGYTFAGWFTGTGGSGTQVLETDIVSSMSDTTLYAAWTINQYTVSFDSNGGSEVSSVTQDYGTTAAEPEAPTRTGYTFAGWYADAELTSPVTWPLAAKSNVTLYAAWTANTYTVTFDPQDGEVSPDTAAVTYDGTFGTLPTPVRIGYTFSGWFTGTGGSGTQILGTDKVSITADRTLYAAWTINQYTIYFLSNGGSDVAAVTQDYGTTVEEPATPARTGYTFSGWYADTELTSPASWPLTIGTSDVTLYAGWTINQYTVCFDSGGGSEVSSVTQDYGTTVTEPEQPERSGYTFDGWYADAELTSAVTWPLTIGAEDVTLYADWTANTYTVTFDPQDGEVSPTTATVTYDSTFGTLPTPIRTGYTFSGWFTGAGGSGTQILGTDTVGITADTTLYASWMINQYTVSFDINGGSEILSVTQDYGSTVTEPEAPTRSGYTFAGWYADTELTSPVSWPLTIGAEDVTLHAAWTINQYTVSFDSGGGSEVSSVTQDYGSTVSEPEAPTRSGYTFAGWYLDAELASPVSWPITIGANNITLHAAWTANTYTVTFDPQDGSVSPDTATVTYDSTFGTLPTPVRTGYTFSGWFTGTGGSGTEILSSSKVDITEDMTLYASWTINQYTVYFDSSGGSEVSSVTQDYGTTVAEPAAPTRNGYTFAGWYADAGLTSPVSWPLTVGAVNVTLHAAWTTNQYTVSFDSGGGSEVSSVTHDYGSTVTEPEPPTRSGYTFAGWYTDQGLASPVSWPLTIGAEDVTLHAAWTINQYTVSFDSGGGSEVSSITQDYGSKVTEPEQPERSGYTFAGWYADAELASPVSWPLTIGAEDVTLHAAWTVNQYTVNFDSNGGSELSSVTQDYGSTVTEPEQPERSGYTFAGWYVDTELASPVSWPLTIGAEDVTLRAAWTIKQYTVSFDSGGGSEVSSVTQNYGSTVSEPEPPTRSGYTFAGWYLDAELTSPASWPLTIGANNVTLYAAWTINQYTVSFDSGGGSEVSSVTQDYGSTVTEPEPPTRNGYTFAGWYLDTELTSPASWPLTIGADNITLYAAWTANAGPDITYIPTYTVSFESNGGDNVISQTVLSGNKLSKPSEPSKEGYVFDGWFKDSDCTIPWDFSKKITGSITLYAKWSAAVPKQETCTVSFDSNGGGAVGSQTVACGSVLLPVADPSKSGYTFAGWYADAPLTEPWDFVSDVVSSDMTLYAGWTAIDEKDEDDPQEDPSQEKNTPVGLNILPPDDVSGPVTGLPDLHLGRDPDEPRNTHIAPYKSNGDSQPANDTETKSIKTPALNKLLHYAEPWAALLVLLLAVLLASFVIRNKRRQKVCFYDSYGEVCTASIHRNKVDLTKAIEKASGKSLKVHISDWYAGNEYGKNLEFYYNGAPIGTVAVGSDNDFVIDLC